MSNRKEEKIEKLKKDYKELAQYVQDMKKEREELLASFPPQHHEVQKLIH